MAGRLVTIATFGRVSDAHLVQGALETAGIKSAISEEDTSPVLGQFVTSATGVKLVVQEEDEEAALKVLDETFAEKALDEAELAAQAEAEAPEDPADAAETPPVPVSDPVADSATRENEARTALFTGCLGWFVPFVHLFAVVMMLSAASGPGELSRRGRRKLWAAVLIVFGPWMLIIVLALILSVRGRP